MDRIGRYKVVRELGRGAMGVVYHAIDPNIGRPVAIKTIRLGDFRKPEEQARLRERLMREARSAGMLSHPGIVTIYDVEQQGDLAYIAMEYVDGPTLDHLLSQPQPLPPERMFSILSQTAAALDYAHQKGIVHRDIKPANIMIAADGTTKITDFGIAKITATDQFTMTGTIVGTPHYMSPEQVQGAPVDGRSDQFSLAVIAYEILTGEKPYTGEHLTTVVYKIVAEEPVTPHRLNPTISGAIENVLRKALAKKAEGRYRTCQEFAESLEKACQASRGWKAMARGGGLNEPTVAEAPQPGIKEAVRPAIKLPPARHPRLEATTTERVDRKSGFGAFLVGILIVTGVLAVVGWRAGPWISQTLNQITQTSTPAAPQQKTQSPASPQAPAKPVIPPAPSAPAPASTAQTPPTEEKPSPMPPPKQAKAVPETARETPELPVRRQTAQQLAATEPVSVTITSSPAGATATLEDGTECKTPCSLDASPGRHSLAVTLPGYQIEHRQVDVGSSPMEVPAVVLRAIGGTLMLTSEPKGASISVDGRKISQLTPAQIPLSPGSYKITVEKDGKQNTQTVDVQNGKLTFLKIPLEQ
jgi:serine/threonine protein kinase